MITIGRDASCNFVIDSPRVSGSHCQIRFMADRFEVTDLGSSNGTFVGVERTRVQAPTTVFPGQPLFLGTIEVSPTEVAGRFGLQWPAAAPAAAPRASGAGLIVVGRDGSCDFVIDSPKISGRHCQLRFAGDRVEVTDLGSSNGTFVGDERVRVQGTVAVFPGQSVFMSTVPLPIEEIARRNGVTWAAAARPAPATVMDSQPSGAEVARLAAERAALEQERMRLEQARAVAAAPRAAAPVAAPVAAPSPVYAAQPKAASNAAGIMVVMVILLACAGGLFYIIDTAGDLADAGAFSPAPSGGEPASAAAPAVPAAPAPPQVVASDEWVLKEGGTQSRAINLFEFSDVTVSLEAAPKEVSTYLLDRENWLKFQAGERFSFQTAWFRGDNIRTANMKESLPPGDWYFAVKNKDDGGFNTDTNVKISIIKEPMR